VTRLAIIIDLKLLNKNHTAIVFLLTIISLHACELYTYKNARKNLLSRGAQELSFALTMIFVLAIADIFRCERQFMA